MTSPVSGVSGAAAPTPTTPSSPTGGRSLGMDDFLKLLVAQMKYQDPSKPMDTSTMMAQTATYTEVSTLTNVLTAQQSMVSAQRLQSAADLVGRTVTYTTSDGRIGSGAVTSATLTGSEPTLRVGNTDVPLSSVTEVRSSAG